MNLKTYREEVREIGPAQAAKELEVTYVRYWRWETGANVPQTKILKRITEWSEGQVTANDFIHPQGEGSGE